MPKYYVLAREISSLVLFMPVSTSVIACIKMFHLYLI